MNARRIFIHKIIYLVAIGVLLIPLFWLGRPATRAKNRAEGSPGGKLAQLRTENGLNPADLGEIDPTSQTIKLATLGFRGVAANILWTKANEYKMKKDWTNMAATLNQIIKLQPNFITVWRHQAWNLSYNVSVEFDDYRQRYRWVIKGINFLKKGVTYNQKSPKILSDTGWFIAQKIGRADEKKQYRELFKKDNEFHGKRPIDQRDNWLVGREWFLKSEDLVDNQGIPISGNSPLIFRSEAPMCLMNYADAVEADGTFGPKAQAAWKNASDKWEEYGRVEIPTSSGTTIRLGDYQDLMRELLDTVKKLNDIEPGLFVKLIKEKAKTLSPDQIEALQVPAPARTPDQQNLVREVSETVQVNYMDVAKAIQGARQTEAIKLAERAQKLEDDITAIRRYRSIVNFEYWWLRANVEQMLQTLEARETIYKADQALAEGDLPTAKDAYTKGLAVWRRVLDQFPPLVADKTVGDDLMDVIKRYGKLLAQLDETFPDPFILQDIVNEHWDEDSPIPKK